ncbi:LacI family DNA-binding transcriptional regulator [Pelagibacterium xiamenense]|uniref:LacI family DNA-binding transcriptional regulator n=1 Tax=Pelagibacterium xiamenense TaxID=2901140 RepID=UPI001E394125|nr:LacI family DNA-binding transcriptional regulator [Pelagibacterium xiamenense]MCD7060641.1 LacI family transcriptional regulator [Pelagibacterium xiamenense]
MPKITLQTLAEETGLSKFAVSRALAGKSGVSDATRARVLEAADRLGYNRTTRKDIKPIGLVFDDTDVINSELHLQIQSGTQREADRQGYPVRVQWTHFAEELAVFASRCSGLLLVGPHRKESLARAYATGVPIVRLGWVDPLEQVDRVAGTDHDAGVAVADYLYNLGHRTIIYVQGIPGYRGRLERLHGLREGLEDKPDASVINLDWEEGDSFKNVLRRRFPEGFDATAFFCSHDGLAVTVVSELLSWGYRIPEDISVIGFGDHAAAKQILPQLTTVRTPGYEIGVAAVRLILDRLQQTDGAVFPMRIQIPCTLVERDSVAPCPTAKRSRTGRPRART